MGVEHLASVGVLFPVHRCIPCKGARFPPTLPRPAVAILPFKLPYCQVETEKGQMEVWNGVESTAGRLSEWGLYKSPINHLCCETGRGKPSVKHVAKGIIWIQCFVELLWFGSQLFLEEDKAKLAELMQSCIYT